MPNNEIFAKRLTKARKIRGLSQGELAKKSGLKPAAISHFETGARKPSFDNLKKLSDSLDVTSDYLMGRTENIEGFAESDAAYRHGFKKLSAEQRDIAVDFINMLAKKK